MADAPSPYAGTTPVASLASSDGVVTLVEGQSFCVSGRTGDIDPDFPHGVFLFDARVVSRWELRLNGHRLEPLAVDLRAPFSAAFVGHSVPARGHADADVVVFRHRDVGLGMRERIVVANHGLAPVEFRLELACDADFADLFAVKESRVRIVGVCRRTATESGFRFTHRDGFRWDVVVEASGHPQIDGEYVRWAATIEPGAEWSTCIGVSTEVDGVLIEPRFTCGGDDLVALPTRRMATWHATLPRVETDYLPFAETLRRTAQDLGALRIDDPDHPEVPILAAGAPWFMTVFGRDSLLTAWMTLIANSNLAYGVLETLARFQGADVDPATEEAPGKILHEMRFGRAPGLSLGGANVYYGSIDATPLFVMLVAELSRWSGDRARLDRLLPHVDRALAWIEEFGDLDGDGFVEYRRSTEQGLANQGWKDSWDSVRHAGGRLAEPPIALCEVQGYVYAAYVARAQLAREAADDATFDRYRAKALELRRRFNEAFWVDELDGFALALDADHRPVAVSASNVGHCLWTGIVDVERAQRVADRLLSPEMFSGFGIRTLASSMAAYNPISYHNGSVWPHDTAIAAAGLARYGFVEHAHRIIDAQLDAARAHHGRLPELFAGFDRRELAVPAPYPTSCSPQAWASAAPLLWLRTMLRLDPGASARTVWLDPAVPERWGRLTVSDLRVGEGSLTVAVDDGEVDVSVSGEVEIRRESRPPVTDFVDLAQR